MPACSLCSRGDLTKGGSFCVVSVLDKVLWWSGSKPKSSLFGCAPHPPWLLHIHFYPSPGPLPRGGTTTMRFFVDMYRALLFRVAYHGMFVLHNTQLLFTVIFMTTVSMIATLPRCRLTTKPFHSTNYCFLSLLMITKSHDRVAVSRCTTQVYIYTLP